MSRRLNKCAIVCQPLRTPCRRITRSGQPAFSQCPSDSPSGSKTVPMMNPFTLESRRTHAIADARRTILFIPDALRR
jgi:hypothetical protein